MSKKMTAWGYIGRFFAVICFLPLFFGGEWYHTVLFGCFSIYFIGKDNNLRENYDENS
ncbi:hypothetical protein [Alteromonas macleodii]|uniref:Uncharacterized protein n=1 Tax=Alteromonas macleodii TaxID=28108 RepID=A0AB36FN33_ALTMA|nr:hypothetical protein [Alteromonas macleodii]OES24164.1 hypothetical protein BFV93_4764 [Alteromonas macleodii]OES24798.1 hypothetical protein BFV95_4557 [Alteromonas macleodii]OES25076.1 hypothetical protein BFV94_4547 [Alteromonas macleodii]OES39119.1 hypothetical protein BFV96_4267 [Alteromonas macleodii]